jgi:hypothetical protein
MSRAATSNDVALYAVDKQIINEGDTIYFTETMRKAAKLDDNSDGVNNGKNAYNEFIKDPIGRYFESTGVKLGVKEDKEGNTIYTIPPRLEGEEPVELNMSNKNNEKLFYNMLLGVTKMGTGNSAKDKLFRKQFEAALEKGTTTKKIQAKKESDDYFSGEADKATAKEKKKPGPLDNINKK